MFNKLKFLIITMVVLLALPVMAGAAYYVSPTLQPAAGGSISPADMVRVEDDAATTDFDIIPNAGYEIGRITLNGALVFNGVTPTDGATAINDISFTDNGDGSYGVTAYKNGTTLNAMIVTFRVPAAEVFSVSRTATGGGAISAVPYMTETALQQLAAGAVVTFKVVPNNGYQLDTFTVDGVDATASLVNGQITLDPISANVALVATFSKIVAVSAGLDLTLPTGEAGLLKPTINLNAGAYTCAWTGDVGLTFGDAAACETSVTVAAAETLYTATLTVTAAGGPYTDTVNVIGKSAAQTEAQLCASCHTIRNPELYTAGVINAPHIGGFPAVATTYGPTGAPGHDGQAMYTAGLSCADCHTSDHSAGAFEIYQQYADSGHGDANGAAWIHYPWAEAGRVDCQPCHTTTGFVNKLTGATNTPAEAEMLTCVGCHENAGTGELRAAGAYTAEFGNGASYAYPEIGASNLCVSCHTGRESGESIDNFFANFVEQDLSNPLDGDTLDTNENINKIGFINSHYLAAGADVFAATGYTYGVTMTGGFHQTVGVANVQSTGTAGPCVTCHMGVDSSDHTWEVVSHDDFGAITAVNSNACVNCHTGMTPDRLEMNKANVDAALLNLKDALAAVGVGYTTNYPYFTDLVATGSMYNWNGVVLGDGVTTNVPAGVMGAAYNYNLLAHDPGAYAHNGGYALQLIAASIDFLADGFVNSNGVFTAVAGTPDFLAPVVALTPEHAGDNLVSASFSDTCAVCHNNTKAEWTLSAKANENMSPSSGLSRYATDPKTQAQFDAGDYTTTRVCQTCHAPNFEAPAAADLTADTIAGAIGCAGCHTGAAPVVDAIATCGSCHDGTKFHSSHGGDELALVTASAHNNTNSLRGGYCDRCHTTEGSIAFGDAGYTGDAEEMHHLSDTLVSDPSLEPATQQPVSCAACHDPHNGGLRVVADWDPNDNGVADQFDLCTSCHTYYNQDGVLTATGFNGTAEYYHATSWYRTIPSTHYDDPATGKATGSSTTVGNGAVEGYVIRTNSENPCFDCHGHELRTNTRYNNALDPTNPDKTPTIHTEWAKSGHAGGLLNVKNAKYDELKALGNHPTEVSHSGAAANWASSAEGASMIMAAGATDDTSNGGYTHYNWDAGSRASCAMCHTSTGFVNYVAAMNDEAVTYDPANNDFSHLAGWNATDGSTQNEMLYCWGCHSNSETGDLRVATGVSVTGGYTFAGADVVFPNSGKSNTCIVCHGGRGNNEVPSTGSRFAGHHAPAAATLFSAQSHVGGEFPGLSYANVGYFAHATLGADGDGACVVCHMDNANHEYAVVNKDETGVITAVNSSACAECHTGAHGAALVSPALLDTEFAFADGTRTVVEADILAAAALLEDESEEYQEAGQLLVDLLANTVTNYAGAAITNSSTVLNDLRAFQNSKLAGDEKGGFAHNRYYVKRLIFDSIDYLEDGTITGAIADYTATYPGAATWLGTTRP